MAVSADVIDRLARWVAGASSGVAFTGAGISTESGIPDFRSPGGVWSKNTPVYYDEFLASADARFEYWRQKSLAHGDFAAAEPNEGHRVLSQWEQAGYLRAVVTQNIDGLHQAARSRRVLELHGTAREILCVDCQARFDPEPLIEQFRREEAVPPCSQCGGRLKSATISFGQPLPEDVLSTSIALCEEADLFLAIGSSLVVEPAASLPPLAHRCGARLVIVNRDPTPLDDVADLVVHESIGATLSAVQQRMAAPSSN